MRMIPIDHMHAETKVLKVYQHLKMICSQYLVTCFSVVTADCGPRRKKGTLQWIFANQESDLLVDICVEDVKKARKEIHTKALREALASRVSNGY